MHDWVCRTQCSFPFFQNGNMLSIFMLVSQTTPVAWDTRLQELTHRNLPFQTFPVFTSTMEQFLPWPDKMVRFHECITIKVAHLVIKLKAVSFASLPIRFTKSVRQKILEVVPQSLCRNVSLSS